MSEPKFVLIRGGCRDADSEEAFVDFEPLRVLSPDLTDGQILDAVYAELAKEMDAMDGKMFPLADETKGERLYEWLESALPGDVLRLSDYLVVLRVGGDTYLRRYTFSVRSKTIHTVEDDTPLEDGLAVFNKPMPKVKRGHTPKTRKARS